MRPSDLFVFSAAWLLPFSSAAPQPPDTDDAASSFLDGLISRTGSLGGSCRNGLCRQHDSLVVDLGYGKYKGYANTTTGINIWKGIRYAAPPTGALRWQPPQPPSSEPSNETIKTTEFGPICPQAYPAVPGLPFVLGDEDCLFLNVYAPANATNLPVMVWIHGGGYGIGNGRQDMSEIINDNGNKFISVVIQYRLGAFGFLSSAEVKSRGAVNAGFLDQAFALGWVQEFICNFGGDRKRVTIAGESAGAASVMYHTLAADGGLGTRFFKNGIAASNYLPFQYRYDADIPTKRYNTFAEKAGCSSDDDVLECLRVKDSTTLQLASANTTSEQTYGQWAFSPVTDGVYIRSLPTEQMARKKVNGERILVGNNANEGPFFTPHGIVTESDLLAWLRLEFPNLSSTQIDQILAANPTKTGANGGRWETNGLTGLTVLDVSQRATGQQQRAILTTSLTYIQNILGEATFVCPSYWLSTAFTLPKTAWHYQYSVPYAAHAEDVQLAFGPATSNQGREITLAFRRIWGNFIVSNNPSISNEVANGASSVDPSAKNGASEWPMWTETEPQLLNLNQTGGVPFIATFWGVNVTQFRAPGQRNQIFLAPADSWEGGRGGRCDFWRSLAPSIPA
ncbi:Lipase 4-like protein 4 [Colletotrichum chlorophyti]|uniref:Carboxylic ester hydrolase n=1 Tax=Colletotrichum chlorophyti TaxID=708187 RepID=A0A1Q8REF5_9PEZI|nr:Lipase 4-like protein 4 [Colletotrichum chlorophyti]